MYLAREPFGPWLKTYRCDARVPRLAFKLVSGRRGVFFNVVARPFGLIIGWMTDGSTTRLPTVNVVAPRVARPPLCVGTPL